MVRLRRREMTPLVGSSRPASSLNSVDLPPPFSPTSPMRSPSIISRSMSRKTRFPPKSLLTLEKFTNNISGSLLIVRVLPYLQLADKCCATRDGQNLATNAMQKREWRDGESRNGGE